MSLGGFYRGEVVDARDPRELRRVRLRVPAVFGDIVTGWAEPLFDSLIPREGTRVWVAFEAGDKNHPLYLAPRGVTFYSAMVVAVSGADVQLSIPEVFGTETTGWASPLQDGPIPGIGATVWATIQEDATNTALPDRQQLVYVNPSTAHTH